MNEFGTYEYVVARKNTGAKKLKPILFIVGYVVFALGLLTFALATKIGAPLISLAPLALAVMIFFTWRYTKIEYEYSITSGVLTFSEIYGGRSRKVITEFKLKDCLKISPLSELDRHDEEGVNVTYNALPNKSSPSAYFATFDDNRGRRCIFFFEATEKALKICRFYNPSHTKIIKVNL